MLLTSPHHPLLKATRRAASGGQLTEDGLIAAEGPHLLAEALDSGWVVEKIIATEEAQARQPDLFSRSEAELVTVSARAFAAISTTEHSQGIMAMLRPRSWTWNDVIGLDALVLVLDRIGDPGNAGTIIRSAEAFGCTGVVFLTGCVNIANAKLLRAAAGSAFRVPFVRDVSSGEAIEKLQRAGLRFFALTSRAAEPLCEADFGVKCAIAVGNEGAGMSHEIASVARPVSIPTCRVESLNAAVACSIALFHIGSVRTGTHATIAKTNR